jgi:FkbM family methyltransferase
VDKLDLIGHAYLQGKSGMKVMHPHVTEAQPKDTLALVPEIVEVNNTSCGLPEGAVWCQVRLKNFPAYYMAVRPDLDMVSENICEKGYWEEDDPTKYGTPGHMLDIGANLGYYSFAFAQVGWTVDAFEPMERNRAMINATMCRNPLIAQQIHLNAFGLGSKTQECTMMSAKANIGNGFLTCEGEANPIMTNAEPTDVSDPLFEERGHISVRRFEDVLQEERITKVDLVKIDVEGYELQVFLGAPNFLQQYKPRIIKSEAWLEMVGGDRAEDYIKLFADAGYDFFSDPACNKTMDPLKELRKGGIDMFVCHTL